MSMSPEIAAAHDDVLRARAQISSTVSELESRILAPVVVVREKLNVVETVRNHPWPALAAAVGAGVLIAVTGADRRAAWAAAETARQARTRGAELAEQGVEVAKHAAVATAEIARQAPSRTRAAATLALDSVAAKLAMSFIERLRHADEAPTSPSASDPSPVAYPRTSPADDARMLSELG